MGKSGKVLDYINENYLTKTPPPDIRVIPIHKGKVVYGLTICFNPDGYERKYTDFEKIEEVVYDASSRSARVTTLYSDYNFGQICIAINVANSKYSDEGIISLTKKVTNIIKKKRLPPPACT